jgi:putative nucleotidyltransferase with HDIG domain
MEVVKMRLISIDEYNHNLMQLAKPIYDKQRRVLLAAGRSIHPVYLGRLKEMDIRYLFVEDAESSGITIDEMVDFPTWIDAIETVQRAFQAAANKEEFPVREVQKLALKLAEEVGRRKAIVLVPASTLAEELRDFAHAVNTALLSLKLAKKRQVSQRQIRDLAVGALLHDIGKAIAENGEDHAKEGFEFLRKRREISLLSAHMSYQHHEHADGSGSPRGLEGSQIHEFAQICGISNMYDNLISKDGMPPHEAMEYMMAKSGTVFTIELVKQFVQEVPSYIPGSKVLLNNGRKAIVTKILKSLQRPFIRYLDTGVEISLAEHHTLLISGIIEGEGLY